MPKYRRAVLVSGADRRLKAIIRKVCAEWKVRLIKREVIPDPVHVHVRVAVDPQYVRFLMSRVPEQNTTPPIVTMDRLSFSDIITLDVTNAMRIYQPG